MTEREVENPWVINNITGKKILDVGCHGNEIFWQLTDKELFGIDILNLSKEDFRWTFYQQDIRTNSFPNDFFDTVISISTIEHIGLGHYKDYKEEDGDKSAMREIRRIVKSGGQILITVPFGKRFIGKWYRVYNKEMIKELVKDLILEKADYFMRKNEWVWTSETEAENVISDEEKETHPVKAIVCLKIRKP